jgi:hypothetical protein
MSHDPALLYIRELPGGGYVTIEGQPATEGAPYHAVLAVERRSDPDRRAGHEPPVVVETEAATQDEVLDRLVAIANSNVNVAAALLRWTAARLSAGAAEATAGPAVTTPTDATTATDGGAEGTVRRPLPPPGGDAA